MKAGSGRPRARVASAALLAGLAALGLQGCYEEECRHPAFPEMPASNPGCSPMGEDCRATRCCQAENERCYVKDTFWAACLPSCVPGESRPEDDLAHKFSWDCTQLNRSSEGRGCGVQPTAGALGLSAIQGALTAMAGASLELQSPTKEQASVAQGLPPGTPGDAQLRVRSGHALAVHHGHSDLDLFVAMNDLGAVRFLLDRGDSVNDLDKSDRTALLWAIYSGPETVETLLEAGAWPNEPDVDGVTPAIKIAQGFPGEGNLTRLMELILRHHGSDEPLLARDFRARKSPLDWAKLTLDAELLTFLEARRPGQLAELLYAVRQLGFWTHAPYGLLLGVAVGLLATFCRRRRGGGGAAKGTGGAGAAGAEVPEGAWLLAAEAETRRRGRWGKRGPLLRKMTFIPEIIMNVVFLFGHSAHTLLQWELKWTLVYWFLGWWAPAALAFGAREVYENPALIATTGRGPRMALAAVLHFLRFCVVFMVRFDYPYAWLTCHRSSFLWQWMSALSIQFNECGTLPLGFWTKTEINIEGWFNFYFRTTVYLCLLSPFLLCLRSRAGEPSAEAVQALAEEITAAGSAGAIKENVEGVDPVGIWGLRYDISFLLCDVFSDIAVMGELLERQHYLLFAISLAIFVSSILPQALLGDLVHLLYEMRSSGTSAVMGFKSDRLLSCFRHERGWEGFFQLALTAYSLTYLADEPSSFLKAMASMGFSTWSIACHLYTSVDLHSVSPEAPWDEALEDGTTSASTADYGSSSQESEASDLA